MKKRKAYKPKIIKIPMTKALYDEFGLQMHTAFDALVNRSSLDGFDALAHIMNVITTAARENKRFKEDMLYLTTGIATMNQILKKCESGLPIKDYEAASIGVAVTTIDRILPYIDLSKIYLAMNKVKNDCI